MNPLQSRLAGLRRWLRFVVTVRGFCWLVSLVLTIGIVMGWLDWRIHLPGMVRAIALIVALAWTGWVSHRYLIRPLKAPADDLSLALRIESQFPSLKDALASTVQFLDKSEKAHGSPELRLEVVHNTLRRVGRLEFKRVVDTQGLPLAGLSIIGAGALTCAVFFLYPTAAWTALERLANPFGGCDWPRQTQIGLQFPARIAKGESFEVHAEITGVIPGQGIAEFEGLSPGKQSCNVITGRDSNRGTLVARRERVEKSFRFQVRAHDAVTGWQEVTVMPPPMLVPLDGRPSPQIHLRFPSYTDLPDQDLPDGTGNIDAVAGTQVTLRAATDRPVVKAWIEFRPYQPFYGPAAFLGPIGLSHPFVFLAAFGGGQTVWDRVPIPLDAARTILQVRFQPAVTGAYALRFEDESGLSNMRLFDLRIFRDPEPVVMLERPSASQDSLEVLPGAEITVSVVVEDPLFAIRSMYLEYRFGPNDSPRKLVFYDHLTLGKGIPDLLSGIVLPGTPATPIRLRPQYLKMTGRFSLDRIRQGDGRRLREGDIVKLQFCADDFDDVAWNKKPGRCHEVELRVVDRSTLEANLNRAQAQIQEEIVRLRKMQQEAIKQVIGPELQWRNTGKLRDADIDQLFQADQLQQQIRARLGNSQEGLQRDVGRVLQTVKDNHLPRTGTQERMETVTEELKRLENYELNPIEQGLTQSRKDQDRPAPETKPDDKKKGPLSEARQHQEEVEATLGELLKLLEPWGNLNQIQGEAKALLEEQRKVQNDAKTLDHKATRGQNREQLSLDQAAALDKAAEFQAKLGERTAELLGKMDRISNEIHAKDADMSEGLKSAAQQGKQNDLAGQMKKASQQIRENQLAEASQAQQNAVKALEEVIQSLEEKREKELDHLRKKLQEAENKLADLSRRQEELCKKAKIAADITDGDKRNQELRRLAREQEQLRKESQELVRELTRLRSERARQAATAAGESMTRAGQQMNLKQDAEEALEETLDRLQEARRALIKEMEEVEEELTRERLAKVADQLKRFRERQEAFITESDRIQQQTLQQQVWDRALLGSLHDLGENQKILGEETEGLGREKLVGAKVFVHILSKAAGGMKRAAQAIQKQFDKARGSAEKPEMEMEIGNSQLEALRRIDQLLDALKPEKGLVQRSQPQGEGQGEGAGKNKGEGDGIGVLAQLKGLRLLQYEIYERTESFGKKHPEPAKLTTEEQRELENLRKEQQEIAQMLEELTRTNELEGAPK